MFPCLLFVVSQTEKFVSPRTYDYRFHKIIEAVGIPNTNYHVLRHTFATRCIEAGVDIKLLSEMLGHSNVAIKPLHRNTNKRDNYLA